MKPHYAYHPGLTGAVDAALSLPSTPENDDFRTMVAVFRQELERDGLPAILIRFHAVLKGRYLLSGEQWLADFQERWGNAAVLRAMAYAVEHPEPVVSDVVEFP